MIDNTATIDDLMGRLVNDDVRRDIREAIEHDLMHIREYHDVRFEWDSDGDDTGRRVLFNAGANIIDLIYHFTPEIRIVGDDTNAEYYVFDDNDERPGEIAVFHDIALAASFVVRCVIAEL